jgi:glutamate synthase (NADPH/NADH) large chain
VILGKVGANFGAGMTGGMAFIYDESRTFAAHANDESIVWQRLSSAHWEEVLKSLVEEHVARTDSAWAHAILHSWDRSLDHFWQVCPKEMVSRLPHPLSDETENVAAE